VARVISALLIEFAGCSGAGKTTLARGVAMRLRAGGIDAIQPATTRTCIHASLANAVVAIVGFVTLHVRGGDRMEYARRVIASVRQRRLGRLWKIARSAATYRLVAVHSDNADEFQVIEVVDEGLLTTIALAFAGAEVTAQKPSHFVPDVLLPDLIVHVDCTLDELVKRTCKRPDPPNELSRLKPKALRTWLASARAAYSFCLSEDHIRDRVIRVSNESSTRVELDVRMDDITAVVRDRVEQWQLSSHQSS
jgi:thymidylate kinase